jgi:hypothetical protein
MSATGVVKEIIYPFDKSYRGNGSIAIGDLGNDGVSEIVIGSGVGMEPKVSLYRQDGSIINSFFVYDDKFLGGVNVAIGDVDHDGSGEIITGAMYSGGPHIKVFDGWGNLEAQFFAYDDLFTGGVNVSSGDIDNDGIDEIITAPGVTGGPHIKVFDGCGNLEFEMFAGSTLDSSGTTVATLDVNGDGDDEVIIGSMSYVCESVKLYDWNGSSMFHVLDIVLNGDCGGVNVFGGDIDDDEMDEIGVSKLSGIEFYEMTGRLVKSIENIKSSKVAIAPEGGNSIVILDQESEITNQNGKYIFVDTQRQTLFAYENGVLVRSFLVSTGRDSYPTPVGLFYITKKIEMKDYVMNYGENDPRNYFIPNVAYNLQFQPIYYIHSAYWHNNFGNKMSGGCVNTSYDNAKWIYYWAEVSTPVQII